MTLTKELQEKKVGKAAKSAQKKELKRERKAKNALQKSCEEKNITEALFIGTRVKHILPRTREQEQIPECTREQLQQKFSLWNALAINALFVLKKGDAAAVEKFIGDRVGTQLETPFLKVVLRETQEKLIQQVLSTVFKANHVVSSVKENYNAAAVESKVSLLRKDVFAAQQGEFFNWIKSDIARSSGKENSACQFEELAKQSRIQKESILKKIYKMIFKKSCSSELDLHFLHVQEAKIATKIFLKNSVKKKTDTRQIRPEIKIITGQGKHSEGGLSKIRPEIESILTEAKISFNSPVGFFSFYPPASLVV
ncbi:Hypothetical predicted protein [Cloeon dipterum]|nr:Hypothetical predicted protein [Cloeon dipterum]